ncbi:MAG: methionine--tRNA ligase [Caldilineaceae bacterium]
MNKQSIWYITTSIPYVNAQPHIGFALEAIQTDVLARYHRLLGDDVRFQTGTDENSLKNVQAAEREGAPTAVLVEQNASRFQALETLLGLSCDDFIRTSAEQRHSNGVYKLWRACATRGDIYKRPYQGLYCVGCEQFYEEEDLVDGLCPNHGVRPEFVEEENYFFRLSRYEKALRQLIESDRLRIVPETRKNEVLGFIQRGLLDFSISRSHTRAKGWGIPVPDDPSQVIYVWFDALTNYISALGYADDAPAYQRFWVNSAQRTHVIGKDIPRFHALYWPAMLLSAGAPLPTTIFVHGFITVNGQKISKSLGNAIEPGPLVEQYGKDALRYYLLRKIPATEDGDFTLHEFVRTYNADLADQLGNLLNRVIKLLVQYSNGVIPAPGPLHEPDQKLIDLAATVRADVEKELANFALHKALAAVWTFIAATNKYIVAVEPWVLARQAKNGDQPVAAQTLATTLWVLVEALRLIAHHLTPFLPETAQALANQLGVVLHNDATWPTALHWSQETIGRQVQPGQVLFPKFELPVLSVADRE